MSLASVGFAGSSCQPGKETVSAAEIQSAAGPSPTEFLLFFFFASLFISLLSDHGGRLVSAYASSRLADSFADSTNQAARSERRTEGREDRLTNTDGPEYRDDRTGEAKSWEGLKEEDEDDMWRGEFPPTTVWLLCSALTVGNPNCTASSNEKRQRKGEIRQERTRKSKNKEKKRKQHLKSEDTSAERTPRRPDERNDRFLGLRAELRGTA